MTRVDSALEFGRKVKMSRISRPARRHYRLASSIRVGVNHLGRLSFRIILPIAVSATLP